MTSASSAERVDMCPASAVLPQVEHTTVAADAGSALHEHVADRLRLGVDDAVVRLDAVLAKWGVTGSDAKFLRDRLLSFEWSPPPGAVVEIRLALMPDGSVIRVPEEARHYPGAVITGQFDVLWAEESPLTFDVDDETGAVKRVVCPEESTLWVGDLKGGDEAWVRTVEANFQLQIYALLAARWTGATRVVPAIIFPGPGEGEWDVPATPLVEADLVAIEQRIRRMFERVDADRARHRRGEPLTLVEGRHCEYCPAAGRCPAKTALVKSALAEDGLAVPNGAIELSAAEAQRGVHAYYELSHFLKRLRAALEQYVTEHGPIDLGDGTLWGQKIETRTKIDPKIAREIVIQELGEYAPIAMKITGKSIEDAVKESLQGGRGVQPKFNRIYAKIGDAGGLTVEQRSEWTTFRPEAGAPLPPPVRKASLEQQLSASIETVAPAPANESEPAGPIRFNSRRRQSRR